MSYQQDDARAAIASLLAHVNDQAARQNWHAGRSKAPKANTDPQAHQHSMTVTALEPALQRLLQPLGCDCSTVHCKLPAHAESVMARAGTSTGALTGTGNIITSTAAFRPHALLAPHNSKPNSGVLRKQASRSACHGSGQPALKYDFSGISGRFQPQRIEVQGPTAPGQQGLAAPGQQLQLQPQGLSTIRIEGCCTITHPPAQQAAAAAPSNGGTGSSSANTSTQGLPEQDTRVVRWLVVRDSLPDDVLQLMQPQLEELKEFEEHEEQQALLAADKSQQGGKKHKKVAYSWSGSPLWWVPYRLYVPDGAGWVGGISLYEFTGQLVLSPKQQQQQQEQLALQHQQGQSAAMAAAAEAAAVSAQWFGSGPDRFIQPLGMAFPPNQQEHMAGMSYGAVTAAAAGVHGPAQHGLPWPAAAAAAVCNQEMQDTWDIYCRMATDGDSEADTPAAAAAAGAAGDGGDVITDLQLDTALEAAATDAAQVQQLLMQQLHPAQLQQQEQQQMSLPMHQQHNVMPALLEEHQQHQPQQSFCSREQKQQHMAKLQQQLQSLTLQERQTRHELDHTQLQQPCLPLQQRMRLMKQLNATCKLLKALLLAVCGGYCGGSSAALFQALLQQVEQHNAAVSAAVVDGVVGADRLAIDVCTLREQKFGRTLLHMLASEHPAPVIVPDGSLELCSAQKVMQLVTDMAQIAAPAAAAAAADGGGVCAETTTAAAAATTQQYSGTPAPPFSAAGGVFVAATSVQQPAEALHALGGQQSDRPTAEFGSLWKVLRAATTALAATAANSSSSSSGSSGGSSTAGILPPQQRLELLQLLHGAALRQGRWQEVLCGVNGNGVTSWLTACHWCIPEVLDFMLHDPDFDLHRDMLRCSPNGRLFYHVICREARERQEKTQHRKALELTLAALADKLAASAAFAQHHPGQLQQHALHSVPASEPATHNWQQQQQGLQQQASQQRVYQADPGPGPGLLHPSQPGYHPLQHAHSAGWVDPGGASWALLGASSSNLYTTEVPLQAAVLAHARNTAQQVMFDPWGLQVAAEAAAAAATTTSLAAGCAPLLPQYDAGTGGMMLLGDPSGAQLSVAADMRRHHSAPAADEAIMTAVLQGPKRQKLSSSEDVVHTYQQHPTPQHPQQHMHGQSQEQQQMDSGEVAAGGRNGSIGSGSSGAARQGSLPALWPPEVLSALQQQYIYHTDRPTYDVALLEEVVAKLFGFDMRPPQLATS